VAQPNDDLLSIAKKYYSAELIISPHDSRLSNVIFSGGERSAAAIEIHPHIGNGPADIKNRINPHYKSASLACGLRYEALFSELGDAWSSYPAPIDDVVRTAHSMFDSHRQ
jgi:hypothetical protein